MTTTNTPNLDVALGAFMETKRHSCATEGGPSDLTMMAELHVGPRGGDDRSQVILVLLPARTVVRTGLGAAIAGLRRADVELRGVVLLSEVAVRKHSIGDPAPAPGRLQDALAAGDLSVEEHLLAIRFDAEGHVTGGLGVRYRYDDQGQPVFDPPTAPGYMMGGSLIDDVAVAIRSGGKA